MLARLRAKRKKILRVGLARDPAIVPIKHRWRSVVTEPKRDPARLTGQRDRVGRERVPQAVLRPNLKPRRRFG